MSPKSSPATAAERELAEKIYRLLLAEHPDARCALDYRNAYELAVATILSAQCTDARVNKVTPELFRRWPDPAKLALAPQEEVEEVVHSTGFFRNKARNLRRMAAALLERHEGEMPRTMKELNALPGMGRKTANVILGNAFGVNEGVVVDTHVKRLARRLGLAVLSTPAAVEKRLMALFPKEDWTMLAHLLIFHGRRVCPARSPRCDACRLSPLCPSSSAS